VDNCLTGVGYGFTALHSIFKDSNEREDKQKITKMFLNVLVYAPCLLSKDKKGFKRAVGGDEC
jgi:hypothetical protein